MPTFDLPLWVLILEAAGRDPLRAQEIEERCSGFWWTKYLGYIEILGKAQREETKRLERQYG